MVILTYQKLRGGYQVYGGENNELFIGRKRNEELKLK